MSLIVYKNSDFIIVNKPALVPSQSDPTGAPDALTLASEELCASGEDGSLWLIHRLDRTVGGLLVYARNKRCAAELSRMVAEGKIGKRYIAVTENELGVGEYTDLLLHDKRVGKAFIVDRMRGGVKEARLIIENSFTKENRTLLLVQLLTGRFHQIRAQLSHRGAVIVGDRKYGSRDRETRSPSLFAYRLSFTLFGRDYEFSATPEDAYPWSDFKEEIASL